MSSSLLGSSQQTKAQQDQAVELCIPGTGENITRLRGLMALWGGLLVQQRNPQNQRFVECLCKIYLPIPSPEHWCGKKKSPSQEDFPNLTGNVGNSLPLSAGHFETCFAASAVNGGKKLFTFREVAYFPPFTVGSSHPYPQQRKGKKLHTPCSQPKAKQPKLPMIFCICFSLLSSLT